MTRDLTKNFLRLSRSIYSIANQRALVNALVHYHEGYNRESLKQALQNWPESYPCTIAIHSLMFECSRIDIEVLQLDEMHLDSNHIINGHYKRYIK